MPRQQEAVSERSTAEGTSPRSVSDAATRNFVPGPWRLLHEFPGAKNPNCACAQVWASEWPVAFCDTRQDGEGYDRETQMANARLIAAAPELYAALTECRDQLALLAKDPDTNWWVRQASAALAKASA